MLKRAITRSSALVHRLGVAAPFGANPYLLLARSIGSSRSPIPKPPKKEKVVQDTILLLNQKLLDFIAAGNWDGYASLCCPTLTCFEAEARGAFVSGLPFHKIYYDHGNATEDRRATMSQPHVRTLAGGKVAVLSYVRLVQKFSPGAGHTTMRVEETRVWEKTDSPAGYKLVHFHKSDLEKK